MTNIKNMYLLIVINTCTIWKKIKFYEWTKYIDDLQVIFKLWIFYFSGLPDFLEYLTDQHGNLPVKHSIIGHARELETTTIAVSSFIDWLNNWLIGGFLYLYLLIEAKTDWRPPQKVFFFIIRNCVMVPFEFDP